MCSYDRKAAEKYNSSGAEKPMVKKESALLFWPWEYRIGVPSNHTNLVKFASSADDTYRKVVRHITIRIHEITSAKGTQNVGFISYLECSDLEGSAKGTQNVGFISYLDCSGLEGGG
jgi:hypothetical protein